MIKDIHIENILRVYEQADVYELTLGKQYYGLTQHRISKVASDFHVTLDVAAGVFAALSPNNSESNNYRDLRTVLTQATRTDGQYDLLSVNTYGPNKLKAWRIARYKEKPLLVLGGKKVRSFYQNIVDPRDPKPITIDGHMMSVWIGKRLRLQRMGQESAVIRNDTHYNYIARDYRLVARRVDLLPNQLQSTIWHTWKRVNNILYNPQLKLWDDLC